MKKKEALEKLDSAMRLDSKSIKTRKQYRNWLLRYLAFIEKNVSSLGASSKDKFQAFIYDLVNQTPEPSLSNKKQAYFAVLYFYRTVMGLKMDGVIPPTGRRDQKTFNVLSRVQIQKLIDALPEGERVIVRLLYGTGMRIDECLSIRIKDLDFEHLLIYVQGGKGDKARRVDFPPVLVSEIKKQVEYARGVYEHDVRKNRSGVYVPHLYEKKNPSLSRSWEWFWLFPHDAYGKDPESGVMRRHHIYDFGLQKSFQKARKKARLPIYTTPHILRHTYATHYLERVLRDLPPIPNIGGFARDLLRQKMGHVDAKTTDIYIHLAMPKNVVTNHSPVSDL